jgi:hypothetical protein
MTEATESGVIPRDLQYFDIIHSLGGKRHMAWTTEADALVGTAADRVVALQLGCDWQQVRYRRKTLGIPAWRQRKA